MKKNKLIELLNSIEGNPDIVLWNGFVGDYQDISSKLIDSQLVKITFDHYKDFVELEKARDANDWDRKLSEEEIITLKTNYKNVVDWEDNNYVTDEDVKQKKYKSKKVVYLQASLRGAKYHDRLGSISY
jgi:hypothetical protein